MRRRHRIEPCMCIYAYDKTKCYILIHDSIENFQGNRLLYRIGVVWLFAFSWRSARASKSLCPTEILSSTTYIYISLSLSPSHSFPTCSIFENSSKTMNNVYCFEPNKKKLKPLCLRFNGKSFWQRGLRLSRDQPHHAVVQYVCRCYMEAGEKQQLQRNVVIHCVHNQYKYVSLSLAISLFLHV